MGVGAGGDFLYNALHDTSTSKQTHTEQINLTSLRYIKYMLLSFEFKN